MLRIAECAGAVVSLGRWHLAPPPARADVVVVRRVAGGRVVAAGAGFVGVTLVLPHRAALVADDPRALAPEQVINRCVRGILAGLEGLGMPALYPGRDAVTVGGRTLVLVGFEVDGQGACLFEATIAVGAAATVLPARLDAVDPGGVVASTMPAPDRTTSVVRETGRTPAVDEVAAQIARGYETRMGVRVVARTVPLPPAAPDPAWLGARAPRPALDRRAQVHGQLGIFEVRCAVDGDRLRDVLLAGDFLAGSPAVERVERELRGVPVDSVAVGAVVERGFAPPDDFLLGVGPLGVVTDTIVRAARG